MRAEKLVFPGPSNLSLWAFVFVTLKAMSKLCRGSTFCGFVSRQTCPCIRSKAVHQTGRRISGTSCTPSPRCIRSLPERSRTCMRTSTRRLANDWLAFLYILYFAAVRPWQFHTLLYISVLVCMFALLSQHVLCKYKNREPQTRKPRPQHSTNSGREFGCPGYIARGYTSRKLHHESWAAVVSHSRGHVHGNCVVHNLSGLGEGESNAAQVNIIR